MSKVEVDQVTQQSGTTLTVGGGACKTAVVDATTVTLGRCGGTVSLASGATQSGFGREGSVDWDTSIHTSTVTAVSGKGYFVDTTSGGVTVNLPAASVGNIVSIKDYAGTFDTNACTIAPNGSDNIGGGSATDPTLTVEGAAVTLVYADVTQGWLAVQENVTTSPTGTENFIVATGGTPCSGAIVCTNYKQHTFTGPGTFTVCSVATCAANNAVAYLVVAGGGGGGSEDAGGGGAGGFREGTTAPVVPYTASPLVAATGITVTATPYAIAVGGGGPAGALPTPGVGISGSVSSFSTIPSAGGGGGGHAECSTNNGWRLGIAGGSGGGGAGVYSPTPQDGSCGPAGGAGNTPPVSPAQGFVGGNGPTLARSTNPTVAELGAGGGGATQVGQRIPSPTQAGAGGAGGAGATTSIDATPTVYAGGGGGGVHPYAPAGAGSRSSGGVGGGGQGGFPGPVANKSGTNGGCNTGGGGGGGGGNGGGVGGTGGSGIVIIRYKFQ